MNTFEKQMVNVLRQLRNDFHAVSVKAEFEAEGSRVEEVLRLKDISMSAGLKLALKIGGCEAITDLYQCRTIGVQKVVAPMVESAFALKKYLGAIRAAYPEDEIGDVLWAVNIETDLGCRSFEEMLALPEISQLNGIVVGRGDLAGSLGMTRKDVNHPRLCELTRELLAHAKRHQPALETVVGGGVSASSIPFFREVAPTLDYYETRKVIFDCPAALADQPEGGLSKALEFELLWLKNKCQHYGKISQEDQKRVDDLSARLNP